MSITGGFGTTTDLKTGVTRRWVIGRDGVKRWADNGAPCEPNCDRSECGDYSPGDCDHPDCPARQGREECMSGNWEWLAGRELSLGTVIYIFECTAIVERGDDRLRILVDELLHEDYKSRDRQLAARMGEITPAGAYQQFFDTQARADHAPKEEQEPYKWLNP